jgi:hypothetical protein
MFSLLPYNEPYFITVLGCNLLHPLLYTIRYSLTASAGSKQT